MNILKKFDFQLSHIAFSVVFTALLYVVNNAINIDKITKWFNTGDEIYYTALLAYLILGYCLFLIFFLLLAHPRIIKPLAIVLLFLSASASYFISKYGIAIDRSMVMNTIYTDATEVTGLLSVYMFPYLILLAIFPAFIVLKLDVTFQRPVRYLLSSLGSVLFATVLLTVALYAHFDSISQAINQSRKYVVHTLVPVNIIRSSISATSRALEPYFKKYKKPVVFNGAVSKHDDLIVVLAIGETSRQKSFSLYGYDRDTNPVLSKIENLVTLNGQARIGSTLYALPEILEKNDIKLPLATTRVGIDTACFVNYSLYDNCDVPGEIEVADCGHDGQCYDEDVIPMLETNLASYKSGYRFTVLHLGGGSHGPSYSDRYPLEFQKYKPMCTDADVVNQCTLEQIYNSYDNTILYVDYVVGKIIETLDRSGLPYVFIYISDHGESLMEDGHIFHGMPPGIPLPAEQRDVPLLVKSSVPIEIIKRDEYWQQDVFDTVLDLLSIESKTFDKNDSFIKKYQ